MEKLTLLQRVAELYAEGGNITQYLRGLAESPSATNSIEDILIAYDFQAGSYVEAVEKDEEARAYKRAYDGAIVDVLMQFGIKSGDSLMEVGVGEATTLVGVQKALMERDVRPSGMFGFDLSWSRIKVGRDYVAQKAVTPQTIELATGDLFQSPFRDNSIDFVYTSHSLEPNGGREREALAELYRVARRYVVLLEPAYELTENDAARTRMESHGYVRGLRQHSEALGYKVLRHELFPLCANPLNPTGLLVIEKEAGASSTSGNESPWACPLTRTALTQSAEGWHSAESLLAYPVLGGVPCLLPQNAVVASRWGK